jgi:hypothetical protein
MAALPPPAVCRRRVVARLFVSLYLRAFMTGELSARGARTYYRTIKLPLANARDDGRGDVGLGWLVGWLHAAYVAHTAAGIPGVGTPPAAACMYAYVGDRATSQALQIR